MFSLLAYIDPGAGSLIVQVILAGILGGLAFFGRLRFWIANFFNNVFRKGKKEQ